MHKINQTFNDIFLANRSPYVTFPPFNVSVKYIKKTNDKVDSH